MGIVPRHRLCGDGEDREPTASELAAIEHEWPLIEAELVLLDAEIRILSIENGPSPLDRRRLRRTVRQVLAAQRMTTDPVATFGPEVA